MPLTLVRDLIVDARRREVGVAAFNVITLEHAQGIVRSASERALPVILQVSQNTVAYQEGHVGALAAGLVVLAEKAASPVALHLDHIEDADLMRQGVDCGFTSVMIDAGRRPYEENVRYTAKQTTWLHDLGVYVEAELGFVGGKRTQTVSAHAPGVRTDPDEAAAFVESTDVDALAVAVGTSHAMTSPTATLDFDLIGRLRRAVAVPLVLHGSSGVADDNLRRAIRAGIVKINVGTALNVAFTSALRETLCGSASSDPRPFLRQARDAVASTSAHLLGVINA